MKSIFRLIGIFFLFFPLFSGCELLFDSNDDLVLKTMDARNVRDSTAEIQLHHEGSLNKYTIYGIVYSPLSTEPTYPSSIIYTEPNQGDSLVVLRNLNRLTTYYYRTFATDGLISVYGEVKSFTTMSSMPQISTNSISGITETTAVSGGSIFDDGGETLLEKGICWSTTENPTKDLPTKTMNGRGNDWYRSTLTGLTPQTRYYVRAYATSRLGTTYGEQFSFVAQEHERVSIGDTTDGGLVFYLDETKRHGLVCAMSDLGVLCQWSSSFPISTVARSLSVGSGFSNTSLIVLMYGKGNYAARKCYDSVQDGYNDWYLPTFGEMMLMYSNLLMKGQGKFFIPIYYGVIKIEEVPYWTSTEESGSTAYCIDMRENRGSSMICSKSLNIGRVRAIRSF